MLIKPSVTSHSTFNLNNKLLFCYSCTDLNKGPFNNRTGLEHLVPHCISKVRLVVTKKLASTKKIGYICRTCPISEINRRLSARWHLNVCLECCTSNSLLPTFPLILSERTSQLSYLDKVQNSELSIKDNFRRNVMHICLIFRYAGPAYVQWDLNT